MFLIKAFSHLVSVESQTYYTKMLKRPINIAQSWIPQEKQQKESKLLRLPA